MRRALTVLTVSVLISSIALLAPAGAAAAVADGLTVTARSAVLNAGGEAIGGRSDMREW